ncbi:helix-turn-helix transcriptional regulator [Lactobacillus salivarius]|uniref:Helix-turn-helix transcriptional regulator n=1 Tax=Ligilactobacillus salivarius TaxID=1624 RepID=A0ABD6JCF4_9LACO|nr:helix-turn-helix transcriptional regulator [Ligilactobacillus salivarius]MYY45874.1 helix-turn-helix transcriptional regulator [Ligilactobacillus salivarius]MYY90909.1 helix-turn-helix transcriptional regulator [Ligilactobacillus salivarius]MYZ67233.1 helix-turn-helix transcriptional regulator [Ligilactobacillus salivarius]
MSIYQRIKDVASEKNLTVKDIEKALNFSNGSLRKWVNNANSERLIQVANYLDVSTDYLLGRTEKKHYYDLTEKDEKDIGIQVDKILNDMTGDVSFYGEPMTKEDKEKLRASLEVAVRVSMIEAKKKFTPKKYRGGNHDNTKDN